jgi:uncharacterized protein (DUF885 family)
VSRIYDIAARHIDDLAALDPVLATALGLPGHEREMTDYSPDGVKARADLSRDTIAHVTEAPPESDRDRIARDVMVERLGAQLDLFDACEYLRDLKTLASPLQSVRQVFDQMPRATQEDFENIAARLSLVPAALAGYRRTLAEGVRSGVTASTRQARECAKQAEIWSGRRDDQPSFFSALLDAFDDSHISSDALRADLSRGVDIAGRAYAEIAAYLRDDYLPRASDDESAGPGRYQMLSRAFNGCTLDLHETYEWGWDELYRVEREMAETADRIRPGASIAEAKELLEADPDRALDGVDNYRAWLQDIHDDAIQTLHGTHFDIPERVRRIEVMIPPPGGALIPYYTGPSEDFSRLGRTWWPIGTRTRFPKWGEVSIAYHEGVPGHHLQIGGARCLGDELSKFQRLLSLSGYVEGWALYAERLMGELGYLEDPDYYFGMLSAQALRCVRVIIDIGLHLQLAVPDTESLHPGDTWNHVLALEFAIQRSLRPAELMRSELVRYLGWPAQAISYKVGERSWLAARETAKRNSGADFDLKRFHTQAINLGPMGLAQLEAEAAHLS